jgi:hypothetical protein
MTSKISIRHALFRPAYIRRSRARSRAFACKAIVFIFGSKPIPTYLPDSLLASVRERIRGPKIFALSKSNFLSVKTKAGA